MKFGTQQDAHQNNWNPDTETPHFSRVLKRILQLPKGPHKESPCAVHRSWRAQRPHEAVTLFFFFWGGGGPLLAVLSPRQRRHPYRNRGSTLCARERGHIGQSSDAARGFQEVGPGPPNPLEAPRHRLQSALFNLDRLPAIIKITSPGRALKRAAPLADGRGRCRAADDASSPRAPHVAPSASYWVEEASGAAQACSAAGSLPPWEASITVCRNVSPN